MSSSELMRWGGLAAVVAGVLYLMLVLLGVQGLESSSSLNYLVVGIFIVALLGQLLWAAGLHSLLKERYGRLGAAGYLVTLLGFALQLVIILAAGLLSADVVSNSSLGLIVFVVLLLVAVLAPFVGLVLLGAAILRARVLPSWFGVVLIVGLPVAVLLAAVLGPAAWWVSYAIFWLLVGYALLSSRSTIEQERSGPATYTR